MSFHRSILRHVRRLFLTVLLGSAALSAFAHDPFGLTATAYLWTNRVNLTVVMEFRAGLRLAGVEPRPPAGVSTTNWFAANRPALLVAGKQFCEIESGTNLIPARSVEVVLVVEDHIEFHLEYPPAMERPLRFDVLGLKALAGQGQYGLALAVLDMVHGKVLGQPVLYADDPILVAEIATPAIPVLDAPVVAATATMINVTVGRLDSPASSDAAKHRPGTILAWVFISCAVLLVALTVLWQRYCSKS